MLVSLQGKELASTVRKEHIEERVGHRIGELEGFDG